MKMFIVFLVLFFGFSYSSQAAVELTLNPTAGYTDGYGLQYVSPTRIISPADMTATQVPSTPGSVRDSYSRPII